ncbi:MAG TPA: hypothetical protein VGJ49_01355 [Gaiellaceae bacterium]
MSEPGEPQVAWVAIEDGAEVFSSEGEAVGKVTRAVGDAEADVFTGLAVKLSPLGKELLVPSESVGGIWPTRVDVAMTRDEIQQLPELDDQPAVRIEPEAPGFFRRLFGR